MNKLFLLFCLFTFSFASGSSIAEEVKFLSHIEKQMNASLEDQIQLSIEKSQLEVKISEIQGKIKDKKIQIIKRLKALYSLKQFQWGELLLHNNLFALERNIKILKNLNKYDYELFKEYNSSLKMLALARKNLQETETLIQKNIVVLNDQQNEFLRLEAIQLLSLQKEKKDSLLMFKGHLTRPLDGQLKQEFGTLRDQHNQFYLVNRGELYSAEIHTPVRSVGLGKIIFRDELMRWRETLIIQHDDNYYSIYAGMTNFKKAVGDIVKKNELIGSTAGIDFYFELRHFDNPINPKSWYYKE